MALAILTSLMTSTVQAQSNSGRPPMGYGIIVSNTNNYPEASKLGFNYVKLYVGWAGIEPSLGVFGNYPDNAVAQARANNLHIIASIFDTPAWANGSSPPTYNPNSPPPSANHVGDFGVFLGNLAAHYKGQIDAYEIWNEENVSDTWGNQNPDPSRFVAMLQAAHTQIKQADPNTLVISGGVANTGDGNGSSALGDLVYLQDILQQGAANDVDAIGIHPYPGACSPTVTSCTATPGTYFQRAVDEHNTVAEYGGANLPLWITESGYFSQPGAIDPNAASCNGTNGLGGFTSYEVDETTKANDLVAAYQYANANWPWLGMFIMMNLDLSMDSWRATCDPTRFWALLTSSGAETAAYTALKNMTKATPEITINPSTTYSQASGTVTISGSITDPTVVTGGGAVELIASPGAIYAPTSILAPVSLNSDGTFQVQVDVSHVPMSAQPYLIYLYALSQSGDWITGSVGVMVEPQVEVTPETLTINVDPKNGTSTTTTLTLGRNDNNSAGYGWSATVSSKDTPWLTVSPNSNNAPNTSTALASVNTSGLPNGSYAATITITTGDSTAASYFRNLPITVPVTLNVGPSLQSQYPVHVDLPSIQSSVPTNLSP